MTSSLRTFVACALGLSSVTAAAFAQRKDLAARHKQPTAQQVTFNRDIAPIVFHYCAPCHRPGEAGPFPLLTYSEAKAHARQIAAVTATRFMPPWLPEPQPAKFADELRLSDEQIARVLASATAPAKLKTALSTMSAPDTFWKWLRPVMD